MLLTNIITKLRTRRSREFQKGYNTAIKDMQGNLIRNSRTEIIDGKICFIVTEQRIEQIAQQMLSNETPF